MSKTPPITACMIDLDGTLVDTLGDFEAALAHTLADLQLPAAAPALIQRTVGKGSEHLIRTVLAEQLHLAGSAQTVDALYPRAWQRYQQHYLAINGQRSALFPGVLQGLQALRARGLPLACLTNKPLAFTLPLLAAKGLDGFFAHVFGGDSFARKKPDPLPLLETCRALGSQPAHTLMVGDSENDARAARAAGCPVALLSYGYNHGQPISAVDADAHLDSLLQVADWLAPRP